jgi:hypothetical protein
MAKAKAAKQKHVEPVGKGYILPQSNPHTSGQKQDTQFLVVGMGESLARVFVNREAAVNYANERGLKLPKRG